MSILTDECLRDQILAIEAQRYDPILRKLNAVLGHSLGDPILSRQLGLITEKLAMCNFSELTPEDKALIEYYCPTT